MEVEEFIRNVCLTHCLQQMEYFHGQKPEESKVAERAARSENGQRLSNWRICKNLTLRKSK
ncbi:hypothetical protein [Methanosarcina horonobensis]|uniref:hypothetical protein n=1 Tax=Methanosarcina horonobensis TaxID=418008 RepID=UPI0022B9168E|nr:hypothetical protein [Methanosarcina horonobensis]